MWRKTRRGWRAAWTVWVTAAALDGCALHKKVQPFVMPPFTPVQLVQISDPDDEPLIETDDDEDLPPVPVAEGATVPKRARRKPVKVVTPAPAADTPPVQVAAAPVAPPDGASVIGQLTPGGDQDPHLQQEAADLIAANEKRLSALSADVVRTQSALVGNVRNFQKQAQQALKAGDAEGAKTLATKGKLLLDDLDKTDGK